MRRKKNLLVLTQWSYKDPLIQAYTLPYLFIIARHLPPGSRMFLVTFEQERLQMNPEERASARARLLEKGITLVDYSYSRFGIIALIKWTAAFLHLLSVILFARISCIHAWCTTAGSLGYVLSVVSGKPLVIDSYEPHAEAMVENGTWSREGIKFRLLFALEKKLSRRALYLISATEAMREYAALKYGITPKNFFVKPACVDLTSFQNSAKDPALLEELQLVDKIVCIYAGKFGGIYLTREVFDFFREAEKFWGDRFRALLLTPNKQEELDRWADERGFDKTKMLIRFVSHDAVAKYMALGDFALTPVKPIPTKRYCTPIKDGEYWALGLPVVITKDISDDSDIIEKHRAGAVIQSLTPAGYREAIMAVDQLLKEEPARLSGRIRAVAVEYRSFSLAERIYREIYGAA